MAGVFKPDTAVLKPGGAGPVMAVRVPGLLRLLSVEGRDARVVLPHVLPGGMVVLDRVGHRLAVWQSTSFS